MSVDHCFRMSSAIHAKYMNMVAQSVDSILLYDFELLQSPHWEKFYVICTNQRRHNGNNVSSKFCMRRVQKASKLSRKITTISM